MQKYNFTDNITRVLSMLENVIDSVSSKALHTILQPNVLADREIIERLQKKASIITHDTVLSQWQEWYKTQNPTQQHGISSLNQASEEFFQHTDVNTFGNWVYYPWRNCLVHVLPEKEFIQVRTVRNKFKITEEEQDLLAGKKIGVIGLSVGQSVALGLAMERVFGELRIADFDHLELSNMNRLRSGVFNIGLKKTEIVRREIAEIDPYLKVTVFEKGVTEENIGSFMEENGKLDLLVEECDNIKMKVLTRVAAKSRRIPVIMDTSDRGMIDIERFDLEPNRPLFHGMLDSIGTPEEILDNFETLKPLVLQHILDVKKLSEGAKYSISQIGKRITSWPQLASSVIMGGGFCTHIARDILTCKIKKSGRWYIDLDEFIQ